MSTAISGSRAGATRRGCRVRSPSSIMVQGRVLCFARGPSRRLAVECSRYRGRILARRFRAGSRRDLPRVQLAEAGDALDRQGAGDLRGIVPSTGSLDRLGQSRAGTLHWRVASRHGTWSGTWGRPRRRRGLALGMRASDLRCDQSFYLYRREQVPPGAPTHAPAGSYGESCRWEAYRRAEVRHRFRWRKADRIHHSNPFILLPLDGLTLRGLID